MINYYTFEGPIISLDDNPGTFAQLGLSAGDKLRYTFLINRSIEGIRTEDDGSKYIYDNDRHRVYFFTDLISGDKTYQINQRKCHQDESIITFNRGFESERRFDLLSGSNKHYVNIWGNSIHIGPDSMSLHGLECVYDANKNRSVICSKLSLISISDHSNLADFNEKTVNNDTRSIQDYFRF
jgi:hypothetical protein